VRRLWSWLRGDCRCAELRSEARSAWAEVERMDARAFFMYEHYAALLQERNALRDEVHDLRGEVAALRLRERLRNDLA
jgi:hypothetical protein